MKKEYIVILVSTLLVASVIFAGFNPLAAPTVTVHVCDINGEPIEGATVDVAYDEQSTSEKGIATIEIPQQYTSPISPLITKEGYESFGIVLNPPYPAEVGIILHSSETDFIQGTLYLETTDTPAGSGYVIECYSTPFCENLGTAVTDEHSQFEFEVSIDRTCILVVADFPEQYVKASPGVTTDIVITTSQKLYPATYPRNPMIIFEKGVPLKEFRPRVLGRAVLPEEDGTLLGVTDKSFPTRVDIAGRTIPGQERERARLSLWWLCLIMSIVIVTSAIILAKRKHALGKRPKEPESPPQ
jgi:hypothetical protein